MKKNNGSNERNAETLRTRKPVKKKWKGLLVIVLLVLLVPVLLLSGAYGVFSHYTGKLNYVSRGGESTEISVTPPPLNGISAEKARDLDEELRASMEVQVDWDFTGKDVTNILLIGVDNTDEQTQWDRGNADGLILVSINNETREVVLTSLMRDIYATVPDKGYNTKLTLAYHYAGTDALINTIEAGFGIPIDNYVMVNYLTIIDIVDAVGGLSLDVNRAELYYMQDKIESLNSLKGLPKTDNMISPDDEGEVLLNGIQTAAFLRIRNAGDGDLERTGRARRVIMGLKDKALGMNIKELNALAEVAFPSITTDLERGEILSLLVNAAKYLNYEMVSSRLPLDDTYYFANLQGSMVVIDYKVNREYLFQSIYEGKH